jgi:hypothetical protein
MSQNWLDFGSGLSMQEGLTFSMHSVRGTRLGVGHRIFLWVSVELRRTCHLMPIVSPRLGSGIYLDRANLAPTSGEVAPV